MLKQICSGSKQLEPCTLYRQIIGLAVICDPDPVICRYLDNERTICAIESRHSERFVAKRENRLILHLAYRHPLRSSLHGGLRRGLGSLRYRCGL